MWSFSFQPVFTSRKIAQEFPTGESKPTLIDQQCVVYQFKCDQCDAGYVGYTRGQLLTWNLLITSKRFKQKGRSYQITTFSP